MFSFLVDIYEHRLIAVVEADGDDAQVIYHIVYALRSYLLVFVNTFIYMT